MRKQKQVVIIGGGIIGLASAHYLVKNGAQVTIIEKGKVGDGASHGNCGLLYFSDLIPLCAPGTIKHEIVRTLKGTSPLYIHPALNLNRIKWLLHFASKCTSSHMLESARAKYDMMMYSMNLFSQLFALGDFDCDFEYKGVLTVFKDKTNFKAFQEKNDFLESFHIGSEKISGKDLQNFAPALRHDVAGAWLNKHDWHLRPEKLITSWKKHLQNSGVIIKENCKVNDFFATDDRVSGVYTTNGKFTADAFLLATGAWAPDTLKSLRMNLPVEPGKGYSITMERPDLCPEIPCVLYEKSMVITPWKTGFRLGGTMEFSGFNSTLNPKRLGKLISGASDYLKKPAGHPVIEEWTGLRPMTYDDMPVIDRHPSLSNLIIATGHGMLGLTLATGTGKVVNDLIYETKPELDIDAYSIKRFSQKKQRKTMNHS